MFKLVKCAYCAGQNNNTCNAAAAGHLLIAQARARPASAHGGLRGHVRSDNVKYDVREICGPHYKKNL